MLAGARPSAAKGGVLSGPSSGFDALLHGTEAVVPLPDGKTIPIKLTGEMPKIEDMMPDIKSMSGPMDQFQSMLSGMSSKLPTSESKMAEPVATAQSANTEVKEQLNLLARQLEKMDTLIASMNKSNNINSKILQRQS
jgi:hypothetical protein